jgi:hypothetical protein
MITIELTEDEALSLRNLLDVAVRHEGMRAAIFAVTLDAKNWVKAIQKTLSSAAFKNQTDTRADLSSIIILKPFDKCMGMEYAAVLATPG